MGRRRNLGVTGEGEEERGKREGERSGDTESRSLGENRKQSKRREGVKRFRKGDLKG